MDYGDTDTTRPRSLATLASARPGDFAEPISLFGRPSGLRDTSLQDAVLAPQDAAADPGSFHPVKYVQIVLPGQTPQNYDFVALLNLGLALPKDPSQPAGPDNLSNQDNLIKQIKDKITGKLGDNGVSLAGDVSVDLGAPDERELQVKALDSEHLQLKLVLHNASVMLPVRKPAVQTGVEVGASIVLGFLAPWTLPLTIANAVDQEDDVRASFDIELTASVDLPTALHPGTFTVSGKDDQTWDNLQATAWTAAPTNFALHPQNFGGDEAQFVDTIRQLFGSSSWFSPGDPDQRAPSEFQAQLTPVNAALAAAYKGNANQLVSAQLAPDQNAVQIVVSPSPDETVDYGGSGQ